VRKEYSAGSKRNRMGRYGLDSSDSGEGPVVGSFEHGNEPSGSAKSWEILEMLNDRRLLKKEDGYDRKVNNCVLKDSTTWN
jgi:hypothetical protein